MKPLRRMLAFALAIALGAASPATMAQDTPTMLIYCGITMVRPISELAKVFEQREKVKISLAQGGSEDLYQSARKSMAGDIYFPGEPSYRDKHQHEGLLGEARLVGYNQLAIFVAKGNPKQIKPDLNELLRKDVVLVIGNQFSGSVGLETKQMLDRFKLYPKVVSKASFLMPDSRSLNLSMKRAEADVTLNWRASAFFPDNVPHVDVVDLDPKIAEPQALLLIKLNSSRQPALAGKFMDYVASEDGQKVFRKWGFMDARGRMDTAFQR